MYATVDFICIDWFEVSATRRERELQNEKFLPTSGFEPTTSGLLEWRLTDWATETCDCGYLKVNDIHIPYYKFKQVQPKTRSKIIFKFHFIIYRDLNVTVFSKRFPAIIYIYIDEVQHDVHIDSSIWRRKITLVQNVCCRVLHCVCDGKWIYNCQQQIDPDIVLLFIIAMHDPTIYLIWPPRSTSNVYRYKYG